MPENRLKKTREAYCEHKVVGTIKSDMGTYQMCLECLKIVISHQSSNHISQE